MSKEIIPVERVVQSIRWFRGQKVLLDSDLAALYGVTTGNLNKAVSRNRERFPSDFMFQLSAEEAEDLIFQIGRSKGRGGRRHRPYAFTEQGIAMLSSILNSDRAIRVNIAIMRAFVKLRQMLETNRELARKFSVTRKARRKTRSGNRGDPRGDPPIDDSAGEAATRDRISCSRERSALPDT